MTSPLILPFGYKRTQDSKQIPPQSSPVLMTHRARDSFQNFAARTGYGTASLIEGTDYVLTRLTQNYNLMIALYRNSWLARRVVDVVPNDMMKNGWKFESDITPEEDKRLRKAERVTRIKASLLEGLKWGRLYGGAAGLLLIDGQEDLEDPLDLDSIMPGDFKGLLITDRWLGCYPQSIETVEDINDPDFGLPKYYHFRNGLQGKTITVHHSRLVRFWGDDLPTWEKIAEMYWGASVIEAVFEEFKKRDNASANLSNLIFQANLQVIKKESLEQLLTALPDQAQKNFLQTMTAINQLQSSQSKLILGKDDDFQTFQASFGGLHEIYECFMMDVAGATQIPVTKLFGRSPAGLNATGESDMRNYYDLVEHNQENRLRPALEKILPVFCLSVLGYIPDDLEYTFNPIETPNDKDIADINKSKTDSVVSVHQAGIISDQLALKELKQSGEGYGMWTNITDEDIEKASDTVDKMDMMGGFDEGEEGNEMPMRKKI